MNKWLLPCSALCAALFSTPLLAKEYSACESDREQALLALASQIQVDVSNEVKSETTEKKNLFLDLVSQSNSQKVQVKSNISLMDVQTQKKDGEICLTVTQASLLKTAKEALKENRQQFKSFNNRNNDFKSRYQFAKKLIAHAKQQGGVVTLMATENKISPRDKQTFAENVNKALSFKNYGALVFSGDKSRQLEVNGKTQKFGEEVILPAGEYGYQAQFRNACDDKGSVELKAGKVRTVQLEKEALPTVSFTSPNVDGSDVSIRFNGIRLGMSENYRLKREQLDGNCEGEFSWQAEFSDQSDAGKVSLGPGDEEIVRLDFLNAETIRNLKKLSADYRSGSRFEVYGVSWIPSHQEVDGIEIGEAFPALQVALLNTQGAVLHGPVLDYANWTDTESYHLGYQGRLQLTDLGADNMPLNVFQLPVIPFIYGQMSVGYMGYWDEDKEYQRTDQYEWKNYLMSSVGAGFTLVMSRDFALNIKGQKNFWLDDGGSVAAGLSVRF